MKGQGFKKTLKIQEMILPNSKLSQKLKRKSSNRLLRICKIK